MYTKRKAYVACNFNCRIETQEHQKVTGSQVKCTSGNISKTVEDSDVVSTDTYRVILIRFQRT